MVRQIVQKALFFTFLFPLYNKNHFLQNGFDF